MCHAQCSMINERGPEASFLVLLPVADEVPEQERDREADGGANGRQYDGLHDLCSGQLQPEYEGGASQGTCPGGGISGDIGIHR